MSSMALLFVPRMFLRGAERAPYTRKHAVQQDNGAEDDRPRYIFPGRCSKHREEAEEEFKDRDDYQEHPRLWFNTPQRSHQPDINPEHDSPHQSIPEAEIMDF